MQRESVEASVFSLKKENNLFLSLFFTDETLEIFNLKISICLRYNVIRVVFKSVIWLKFC